MKEECSIDLIRYRSDAAKSVMKAGCAGAIAGGAQLWTSSEGSVRELAAVLGIRYRRISDEDYLH